jgi:hypothetical protein
VGGHEGAYRSRPRALRVIGIVVVAALAYLLAVLIVWALLHIGTWIWPDHGTSDAIRSIAAQGRF